MTTKAKPTDSTLSKAGHKNMRVYKVCIMDGSELEISIEKNADGQALFDRVVQTLNLLEKDYFGLSYTDHSHAKEWVQMDKKLMKQLKQPPYDVHFEVKFYLADPDLLQEDITRYYFCSQIRNDVLSGRLACSPLTQALLGSYFVQAQLGDYDTDHQGGPAEHYLADFSFGPQLSPDTLSKVHELHKAHRGQTPAEAERHYLDNAKRLALYGVDRHAAKDSDNVDVGVAVGSSGILVYRDLLRINRITWPKIIKISYRMNQFYVKVRPGEFEQRETVISFKFPSTKAAKSFWKHGVEQHAFFRLMSFEPVQKRGGTLTFGSPKVRFSGRTLYQSKLASGLIQRPKPTFERSSSSRFPVKSLSELPPQPQVIVDEQQRRASDFKPTNVSSPLKFVDASSKVPTREHSAIMTPVLVNTSPVVHVLRHEKSPDDKMSFELAVKSVPDFEQPGPSPKPTPQEITDDHQVPVPITVQQQDYNNDERLVSIPVQKSQNADSPLNKSDRKKKEEKERQKEEEKIRVKHEKEEVAKMRQKGPKSPSSDNQQKEEVVGGYYELKPVMPLIRDTTVSMGLESQPNDLITQKSTPSSPNKDRGFGRNFEDVSSSRATSLSPTNKKIILRLETSGLLMENGLGNNEMQFNNVSNQNGAVEQHTTCTPPSVPPKPLGSSPKTVTTVQTNEESVHEIPAQVMTVKTGDGTCTTTTTAGQVKTIKQTIQTKSFETFSVPASALNNSFVPKDEIVHEVTRVSKTGAPPPAIDLPPNAKIIDVQQHVEGGRHVETITYEIERDGVLETRTEHRVTVISDSDIDYEQELSAAILEATKMNPKLTVEKVEIRRSGGTELENY